LDVGNAILLRIESGTRDARQPVQIWLVRHAEAVEPGSVPGGDFARPLAERGRRRFGALARWLVERVGPVERIVTSPRVRAVETARLLAEASSLPTDRIDVVEWLSASARAERILSAARESTAERIAFVGHEPDLSGAVGEFLGGGRVALAPGSVACLWGEAVSPLGTWRLLRLVDCELF
jgi:phosphohistidine phosphatase